jgi:ABC-type lipoprotein release transport system permease subunit
MALAHDGRELARTAGSSGFVVSLRNLLRRPGRSIMTGAAVAISMALLVSMAAVSTAIRDAPRSLLVSFNEDLTIAPSGTERIEGAHAVAANVSTWSEVQGATSAAYHDLTALTPTLGDKVVYGAGLVPGEFWAMAGKTERDRYKGGWFKEPKDAFFGNGSYDGRFTGELLVSKNLVEKYGVTVGGTLPMRVLTGADLFKGHLPVYYVERGGERLPYVNMTVVGTFEYDFSGTGFLKELAIVVMHESELQSLAGMAKEAGPGGQPVVIDLANGVSIQLTLDAIRNGDAGRVQDRLRAAYPNYADSIFTKAEQLAKQRQGTLVAQVFYLAVGSVSMVIGLLFVATIMIVSVMERTHEIGMLRAVGISRRTIFLQIFLESMVLVLIGAVVGIAPGYFVAVWAAGHISAQIGFKIVLTFSVRFMVEAMAFVLAVGSLFAMYPAIVAMRMNIVRAITSMR